MRYRAGIAGAVVLLAAVGAAAATPRHAQTLRTCVDRWNEGNMRDWRGYPAAWVGMSRLDRRRLLEVGMHFGPRRCVVTVGVGRRQSWSCVLDRLGAYECPLRHEGDWVPLRHPNARIDERGVLRPGFSLAGTHPPRRLAWQRYPRVDGFVKPWTSAARLRPGLRFAGKDAGTCTLGSELATDRWAIRCLTPRYQVELCFAAPRPARRAAGVVACVTAAGATTFVRFVVSRASYAALDLPLLVPWRRVGGISLGEPRRLVRRDYDSAGYPYHTPDGYYVLHGSRVYVDFRDGVVNDIAFTTRYYRTRDGFGVGSRIPLGPCHRTALKSCEHRWHGFVWAAIVKVKPCSCWVKVGDGKRSLPATGSNFLKHWTIIEVRHGRVARFYLSRKYID